MAGIEDTIEILRDEVRDAEELAEEALTKIYTLRTEFETETQHLKDQIDSLTQQLDEMLETIEELRQNDVRPLLEELVHNLAKRFGIPAVDLLFMPRPVQPGQSVEKY